MVMAMATHRMIRVGLVTALLALWAGMALASGSAQHADIPLTRVYANGNCADPAPKPGISVADTATQADDLWDRCRGRLVLGGGDHRRPPMDLTKERLVYLHMGVRRTGGFRLDLANQTASLVDRTLVIAVIWQEPSQAAIVTQALTHPCLLLSVPRGTHAYDRIEVVDAQGQVRLATPLPGASP